MKLVMFRKYFHRLYKLKFLSSLHSLETEKFLKYKNMSTYNLSSDTGALSIHEVSFNSCGALYKKWKELKKFRTVPDNDLTFNIKYIDTDKMPDSNSENNKLVVLAIHGTPGNCYDFSSLATYFHSNGIRVIVPSFPDFSTFPPGIFRHTDEERAQFVKDFLSAISVSKVDLLICHSGAVYPSLNLCLAQNPVIKSIAMLNPVTFSLNMIGIKHLWFYKLLVKGSEIPIIRRVIKALSFLLIKTTPVRGDDIMGPILSGTVMVNTDIAQMKEKFLQLSKSGIPILYILSENDKLVGKDCAYELAYLFGIDDSDVYYVNKNGIFERNGKETPTLKVVAFENGSHYVFWKYGSIVNDLLLKFLKKTFFEL